MKIKIINPDYGMTDEQLKKRIDVLKKITRNDTVLSMECLKKSIVTIDSMLDVSLAAPEIIDIAINAERQGYDAVVLYCFSDPAIAACREVLNIPVIGAGQESVLTACGLGYNFSLIVTGRTRIPEKKNFINSLGINMNRLASIRSINLSYEEMENDKKKTLSSLTELAQECIIQDKAEAIVLGCLSFLGIGEELSKRIQVPVIDPAYNAVSTAESYVAQGLAHSKKSYPYPVIGTRVSSENRIKC